MENSNPLPDVADVRRRAKITAIARAFSVVTNLLFLTYAFVQKAEADKQRSMAAEYQRLVGDLDDNQQEVIISLRKELGSLKTSGQ